MGMLDGRWVTNMLMVTTTMGMLDGVHGHTSDLGPAVPLDSVLVVSTASLEHGLVASTATSDDADDGPVLGGVELLEAGRRWCSSRRKPWRPCRGRRPSPPWS